MEVTSKLMAIVVDQEDDDQVILPGFRFHPTDEELVWFYLRRKVEKKPIAIEIIKQIDIYKYDPWDLPSKDFNFSHFADDFDGNGLKEKVQAKMYIYRYSLKINCSTTVYI